MFKNDWKMFGKMDEYIRFNYILHRECIVILGTGGKACTDMEYMAIGDR